MPGIRKGISKGGTNNCYGGASRQVQIKALEENGWGGGFIRALGKDGPKGEVRIDGRFVYAVKRKPLKSRHAKNTGIYR